MEVCRSYTVVPPSLMDDGVESKDSLLHLMVKIYPHGTLSALFGRLSIGDEVELSNPEGKFQEEQDLEGVTSLVLCAAGTGFTPMAGLIRHCLTPQQQQSPFRFVCNEYAPSLICWVHGSDLCLAGRSAWCFSTKLKQIFSGGISLILLQPRTLG